jgi:hypothetical protein
VQVAVGYTVGIGANRECVTGLAHLVRLVGTTNPYNWYRQGQSHSRANGQPRNLHVHIAAHTCDRGPGRLCSIPCVHHELRIMLP